MRWIVRIIAVLALAVVLGVGVLLAIPAERIAAVAVGKFNSLTGRTLLIAGAVRPSLWPQLGVRTGAVSVSNADWSDQGPMVQAEGLAIAIDMAALIGGAVRITAIEAIAPQIVLERSATGAENWVFGASSGGTVNPQTPGVGAPFTLDRAAITEGAITYIDHGTGTRLALSGLSGTVAIPDYTGPATLRMSGVLAGQGFDADLGIGAFQPFLDGKLVDLQAEITAGAAEVRFDGRAGTQPPVAEGQLVADLGDLAAVSALLGLARPALPKGLGAQQVSMSGAITVTREASVHLREGSVTLDGNQMSVEADLATAGDRPRLSAQVTAGALDLAGLGGDADAAPSNTGTDTGTGWSRAAIDASGLSALDAEVAFSAEAVDLGAARLGAVQVLATVDRARAVFDLRRIAAYEGAITGQFVVNARKGLSVGGDLRLSGLSMQAALADVAEYDRLIGTGDAQFKFLGVGPSVDAILRSLEGVGSLSFGKGELRGLDIAGMITNLDPGYVGAGKKTIFDGVTASFAMKDGIATNDDLTVLAPMLTATGAGAIDVGAQRLDMRLRPTLITGEQSGVTVPVLISGPWADPAIRLDLESLARENLAAEAAELAAAAQAKAAELQATAEARAAELQAQARAKLEAELGVVQQDGETLEDAAKRAAEQALQDQAAKALGDLLGGQANP